MLIVKINIPVFTFYFNHPSLLGSNRSTVVNYVLFLLGYIESLFGEPARSKGYIGQSYDANCHFNTRSC